MPNKYLIKIAESVPSTPIPLGSTTEKDSISSLGSMFTYSKYGDGKGIDFTDNGPHWETD